MKRKVLSILLAITLIAAMAVPALASSPSSQADITFTPFTGEDGVIPPYIPNPDHDEDDPYCPNPPYIPNPDIPDGWHTVGPQAIRFGNRPIVPGTARLFRTLDTHNTGDLVNPAVPGVYTETNAVPRSGFIVRAIQQTTQDWHVNLSVTDFGLVSGSTTVPLAGFRMALTQNATQPVLDLDGNFPTGNAGGWEFHNNPALAANSIDYLAPGAAHIIASGVHLYGLRATQFDTQMDIPANAFQPTGAVSTQLTWTFSPTPAP